MQFGVRIINSWNGNACAARQPGQGAYISIFFSITAGSSMLVMTYRAAFRIATALFTRLYLDVGHPFFDRMRGQALDPIAFIDRAVGSSPVNSTLNAGTSVPGCSVADDFTHLLGDSEERWISGAGSFRIFVAKHSHSPTLNTVDS
jgi:hypothetical protein